LTKKDGPVDYLPIEEDTSARGGKRGGSEDMAAHKLTDTPIVKVYGKPGCGLCEAAKDKLQKMGLKYEALNLGDFTELHDGWREDNSCEVLAAYMLIDKMPIVEINGQYMDYPSAMRQLKKRTPVEERAATAAEN